MAEIALAFLEQVIQAAQCNAVRRQFHYLYYFSTNIEKLRDEARKLDDDKEMLQIQIDQARSNLETITPAVNTWLADYEKMKLDASRIIDQVSQLGNGCCCLLLRARRRLSKEAMETSDSIKELRAECKFSNVSEAAPPTAREPIPTGTTYHFESRKAIEKDIMRVLKGETYNLIGICGMGGAGKTTMAVTILNRAREEHLFHEVVKAVISQQMYISQIQLDIAAQLNLKFVEKSSEARARKLHARLTSKTGCGVLILLDDIWERIPLEEVGIPCANGHGGCKVIVTSRNNHVLGAMNAGKVYTLQMLSEEESWLLFRARVGTCLDDDPILKRIAEDVMRGCKHLPLALAVVGGALRDEKDMYVWEDARMQLRPSHPLHIQDEVVIEYVYKPIRLSYDHLKDEEAKCTLLLCSLFPEACEIHIEELTHLALGLHLFDGIWELEEARGRMHALIKMLKSRCLLLDGYQENCVIMHDIVRDVCIFIASEKRYLKCSDCSWISSYVDGGARAGRPAEPGVPNLELLLVNTKAQQEFQIDDSFFEGIRELKVLYISYHDTLQSLPPATQSLKSLTTLALHWCESLESISVVDQLESLEILSCYLCSIKELPVGVRELKRLRLLKIVRCYRLKTLVPGVISNLVGLEELTILDSFYGWEADTDGEERKNAGLRELEFLINLRCLHIQVRDTDIIFPLLTGIDIIFCTNIKCLVSSDDENNLEEEHYRDDHSSRIFCEPKVSFGNLETLYLSNNESCKNVWCDQVPYCFFTGLQQLKIYYYTEIRSLFSSSIAENLVNLQKLEIEECEKMVRVIEGERDVSSSISCLFPNLQYMSLLTLPQLESFCEWKCVVELPSLKTLEIGSCSEMRSFSAGSLILPALQTTIINDKDQLGFIADLNGALQQLFEETRYEEEGEREGDGSPGRWYFHSDSWTIKM